MGVNIHILAEERYRVIRDLLTVHGQVLATDLVARFGVSEDTVRRDLRELARLGACRRVYGGAVTAAPNRGPVGVRAAIAPEVKARLAAEAVKLLVPGQLVFIDAGSTNIAIARALPAGMALTVATNALGVASVLSENPDVKLIVLGGAFDASTGACLGAETVRAIDRLGADLMFLGACALDASAGVTAFDPDDAEAKRAMVGNSRLIAVAAIADKLATAAPYRVAPMTAVSHLVTELSVPEEMTAAIEALGCAVHRA
ncbi:transcriptional regulator, DeoR family [Kaistia soli DSM 19436]|uniref:Transcriptional regulator, DeoR family n=1 Tax=Kaistia soli DSM 19436 TaxID=1122133 RepID=A0A1M5GP56_9HYPH|nr:DeoR/GlpR family DNA-binding transcription regulator [Kaistia soli]SHG05483.1 transcriptional regulator, DeoR family [Kaistia soli DSM 19436]